MRVLLLLTTLLCCRQAFGSLLGYYNFDSDANDSSGNGNNGVLSATPPALAANGYHGGAYQFGANGTDTFINLPINISPSVMPVVTFGAWVKADVADPVTRGIISQDNGNWDRTLTVTTGLNEARWALFTSDPGGFKVRFGELVQPGVWTFLAVRYDAINNVSQLLITDLFSALMPSSPGDGEPVLTVGRNPNFDQPFIGMIDEVFVYDEWLSNEQLLTIRGDLPTPEPATWTLFAAGLGLVAAGGRRRLFGGKK